MQFLLGYLKWIQPVDRGWKNTWGEVNTINRVFCTLVAGLCQSIEELVLRLIILYSSSFFKRKMVFYFYFLRYFTQERTSLNELGILLVKNFILTIFVLKYYDPFGWKCRESEKKNKTLIWGTLERLSLMNWNLAENCMLINCTLLSSFRILAQERVTYFEKVFTFPSDSEIYYSIYQFRDPQHVNVLKTHGSNIRYSRCSPNFCRIFCIFHQ